MMQYSMLHLTCELSYMPGRVLQQSSWCRTPIADSMSNSDTPSRWVQ